MNKILSLYKPQGVTPFQLIQKLREEKPEYKDATIGYAGRLDPLAHGVVLLMIGESNKEREKYIGLKKTYEFSVLFGVETDSYDYLGFVKQQPYHTPPENIDERVKLFIKEHTGKITQTYPPFSSKTIGGKALFKLAKENKLSKADLPTREVTIDTFEYVQKQTIPTVEIEKIILENLHKIKGHFRQQETIELWEKYFAENSHDSYQLFRFSISCSSGTYVRALAHKMGQTFGCGAIAFEILRTQVGEFTLEKALHL